MNRIDDSEVTVLAELGEASEQTRGILYDPWLEGGDAPFNRYMPFGACDL